MLLENAMGKGQGTEWERVGHILIGLGHHDNIGSLRSQSLLCKNKHLSASCLGKSRKRLQSADVPAFLGSFSCPAFDVSQRPCERTDPADAVQHPKKPLCLLLRPL